MSKKPAAPTAAPAQATGSYTVRDPVLAKLTKGLMDALAFAPDLMREGATLIVANLVKDIDARLQPKTP